MVGLKSMSTNILVGLRLHWNFCFNSYFLNLRNISSEENKKKDAAFAEDLTSSDWSPPKNSTKRGITQKISLSIGIPTTRD